MSAQWVYTPSCPCRRCEQERLEGGMTVNCYPFGLSEENDALHRGFWSPVPEKQP